MTREEKRERERERGNQSCSSSLLLMTLGLKPWVQFVRHLFFVSLFLVVPVVPSTVKRPHCIIMTRENSRYPNLYYTVVVISFLFLDSWCLSLLLFSVKERKWEEKVNCVNKRDIHRQFVDYKFYRRRCLHLHTLLFFLISTHLSKTLYFLCVLLRTTNVPAECFPLISLLSRQHVIPSFL